MYSLFDEREREREREREIFRLKKEGGSTSIIPFSTNF
jgi:hypothetical protein